MFETHWQAAIEQWTRQASRLRGQAVVVQHPEWIYLLDWLGMQRLAALEAKPGIPASASHLSQLKNQLGPDAALTIIRAPTDDARPAAWLSQQTGLPVRVLPHTAEADAGPQSLYGLFDTLLAQLNSALEAP